MPDSPRLCLRHWHSVHLCCQMMQHKLRRVPSPGHTFSKCVGCANINVNACLERRDWRTELKLEATEPDSSRTPVFLRWQRWGWQNWLNKMRQKERKGPFCKRGMVGWTTRKIGKIKHFWHKQQKYLKPIDSIDLVQKHILRNCFQSDFGETSWVSPPTAGGDRRRGTPPRKLPPWCSAADSPATALVPRGVAG